jgi:hypothetical protein
MDAVYICRHGNNEELRYSLRTVHNLKEVNNVWVIGGKPHWYTGNFIPVNASNKYMHAVTNLHVLTKTAQISEEFILMNDDFYVIKPVDKMLTYNEGFLLNKIVKYNQFNPNSKYTNKLKKTHLLLKDKLGREPLSFELHTPMKMTKKGLSKALKHDVLWRSYYGNMFNVDTVEAQDVKIYRHGARDPNKYNYRNKDFPFISSEDRSFMFVRDKMLGLYKNPSQYEG